MATVWIFFESVAPEGKFDGVGPTSGGGAALPSGAGVPGAGAWVTGAGGAGMFG